jgi:hypothetical protein
MRLARHVGPALIAGCIAACGSGSSPDGAVAKAAPSDRAPSSATPAQVDLPAPPAAPTSPATPTPSTPGGVSSNDPAPASAPASGTPSLAAVEARLDHLLSSASRCTGDAECRSVAVGGKACGGPTGYRAYSTRLADPAAVEALAQQERTLALQAERDAHRVSNCLFMADPGAHCEKQRCETGTIGPMPPRDGAATR